MKSKLCYLLIAVLSINSTMQAQHEFGINAGGGVSSLFYKLPTGEASSLFKNLDGATGFGGMFGISYSYFFNRHWGFGSGVEFNLYNTTVTLSDGFNRNYGINSAEMGPMNYKYELFNYQETQSATTLSIPILLQFQAGKKHQYYAAIGGKIGIPVSSKYKNKAAQVNTSATDLKGEVIDGAPGLGFGEFPIVAFSGNIPLRTAYMLSFEAGIKWDAGKNAIYTGIYADYGLNNIANPESQELIIYNDNNPPLKSNLLSSSNKGVPMVDKVIPLALGVKIKFALKAGKHQRQQRRPASAPIQTNYTKPSQNTETQQADQAAYDKDMLLRAEWEKVKKVQEDKLTIEKPVEDYNLGQKTLTTKQKQAIDKKITLIKKYPDAPIIIYGHTCDLGSSKSNEDVSMARAISTKQYLVDHGVNPDNIILVSKSDTENVAPNNSGKNRRANRRVEISILVNDVLTIELDNQ